jgi:cyclopropane fatty-acyl-phospholipid synthase-like methyltransferase
MATEQLPAFFYDIFDASLPRLGVGDDASTERALNTLLAAMPPREGPMRVLDIGCGNGPQTICLARHVDGSILAVDNHQPFLDELLKRAAAAGVGAKIQVLLKDMHTLTKDDGPFDLVWAEGSLFVMGFRAGLTACQALLAPGGGLAVSDVAWLRPDAPAECRQFFANVYPAMTSVAENLATIEACRYELLDHFTEPESAWWEPYYKPLAARLRALREQHAADPEKLALIEAHETEIDIYRRYAEFYGNVFYVMRRR